MLVWEHKVILFGGREKRDMHFYIDLADIDKLPPTGPLNQMSAFAHELYEDWQMGPNNKLYLTAHEEAIRIESLFNGGFIRGGVWEDPTVFPPAFVDFEFKLAVSASTSSGSYHSENYRHIHVTYTLGIDISEVGSPLPGPFRLP